MNVDKKIQEKLNERKWYHRVTALTLVFSLLCAFFVPLDLVLPGMALDEAEYTQDEMYEEVENYLDDSSIEVMDDESFIAMHGLRFNSAVTILAAENESIDYVELTPFIKSITANVQGKVNTSYYNGADYIEQDTYTIEFKLNYEMDKDTVNNQLITTDKELITDTLVFNIKNTAGLDIELLGLNESGAVYSGGTRAGTYRIDSNGNVTIVFNSAFMDDAANNANGIRGTFTFSAEITQNRNEESDGSTTIAGIEVPIPILAYNHKPDLKVTKSSSDYDFNSHTGKYTVTIETGEGTFNTINVDDILTNDMAFDQNISLKKYDSAGNSTDVNITPTIQNDGKRIILNDLPTLSANEKYVWEYQVKAPDSLYDDNSRWDIRSDNMVTVTSGNLSESAPASIYASIRPSISKKGNYNSESDTIQWTITVGNAGGSPLTNYKISDDFFSTVAPYDIVVSPAGSGELKNGVFEFADGVTAKQVTITYESDASESYDSSVKNTAVIYEGNFSREGSDTVNVPRQQTVEKTYSFDGADVTWTIKVKNPNGRDLSDYVLDDILSVQEGDTPPTVTWVSVPSGVTQSGNTFTFGSGESGTEYTFVYTTPTASVKGKTLSNEAILKDGEKTVHHDEKTFPVPENNRSLSGKTGSYHANSDGSAYIEWVIRIDNQYGTNMSGYKVTDNAFAGSSNFKVQESADGWNNWTDINPGTLSGSDYTFNSGNSKYYQIIYRTAVTSTDIANGWVYNTVGDSDGNGINDAPSDYIPQERQTLEPKEGYYVEAKNEINWKLTISNPYGISSEYWEDKVVSDNAFDSNVKNFKVYYLDENNNNTEVQITNGTLDSSAHTYTVPNGITAKKVYIEYTTIPSSDTIQATNKATYNNKEQEKVVDAVPRQVVQKSNTGLVSANQKTVLSWSINLQFSTNHFAGTTYKDTLTKGVYRDNTKVDDDLTIELEHYVTEEQLNALSIELKDANGQTIGTYTLNDGKFEIRNKVGDNGKYTYYEIYFKDDVFNQAAELNINYQSTGEGVADINNNETVKIGASANADGSVNEPITFNKLETGDKLTYINQSDYENHKSDAKGEITKKEALQKFAATFERNFNPSVTYQLSQLTSSGGWYTLKWGVVVNESMNYSESENITLVDTLPENVQFTNANYTPSWKVIVNNQDKTSDFVNAGMTATPSAAGTNPVTVEFYIPKEAHSGQPFTIEYETIIRREQLTASSTSLKNTIKDKNDESKTSTQTQVIAKEAKDLSKQMILNTVANGTVVRDSVGGGSWGGTNEGKLTSNEVKYIVDINPGLKKLNPYGTTLALKDVMNINKQPQNIELLEDPVIYKVMADGSREVLSKSLYKYEYNQEPVNVTFNDANDSKKTVNAVTTTNTITYEIPDETHIQIEYTYYVTGCEGSIGSFVNNEISLTGCDTQRIQAIAEFKRNTSSSTVEVDPYIKIEKVEENHYDVKLRGAVFNLEHWTGSKWETLTGIGIQNITYTDSQQTVTVENANVPIWDGVDDNHEKLSALNLITGAGGRYPLPYLGNGIYRLTELNPPSGYIFTDGVRVHYFYVGSKPSVLPSDEDFNESDLIAPSNNRITIANTKRSIDVEKIYDTGNDPDISTPPVQVQLYRKTGESVLNEEKAHITVNITDITTNDQSPKKNVENNQTIQFSVDKNKPFSFLISADRTVIDHYSHGDRQRRKVGSGTAELLYDGGSSQYVTTESQGDVQAVTISESNVTEDIVYDLFFSTHKTDYSISLIYNGRKVEGDERERIIQGTGVEEEVGKPVLLSSINSWRYSFEDTTDDGSMLPATDIDGNTYYYYVKEVNVPVGFDVSYIGNNTENGTIQIINKHNPKNVSAKKVWKNEDGEIDATPTITSLTVSLYKSTSPPNLDGSMPDDEKLTKINTAVLMAPEWSKTWTETQLRTLLGGSMEDEEGNPYYFYVVEDSIPENYMATYTSEGIQQGEITVTNQKIAKVTPPIQVQKSWLTSDGKTGDETESSDYRVLVDLESSAVKAEKGSTSDSTEFVTIPNGYYYKDISIAKDGMTVTKVEAELSVKNDTTGKDLYLCFPDYNTARIAANCSSNSVSFSDYNYFSGFTVSGNTFTYVPSSSFDKININRQNSEGTSGTSVKLLVTYSDDETGETITYLLTNFDNGSMIKYEAKSSTSDGQEEEDTAIPLTPVVLDTSVYSDLTFVNDTAGQHIVLDKTGQWKALIDDLPESNSSGDTLFYYFEEYKVQKLVEGVWTDVEAGVYTTEITNNGLTTDPNSTSVSNPQTAVITNTKQPVGKLSVDKHWLNDEFPSDVDTLTFEVFASETEISYPTQDEEKEYYNPSSVSGDTGEGTESKDDDSPISPIYLGKDKSGNGETLAVGETYNLPNKLFKKDVTSIEFVFDSQEVLNQYSFNFSFGGTFYYIETWNNNNIAYYESSNGYFTSCNIENNVFTISASNILENNNALSELKSIKIAKNDYNLSDTAYTLTRINFYYDGWEDDINIGDDDSTDTPTDTTTKDTINYEEIDLKNTCKQLKSVGTITVTKTGTGEDTTWVSSTLELPAKSGDKTLYYYVLETSTGNYKPIYYSDGIQFTTDGKTETAVVWNQYTDTGSLIIEKVWDEEPTASEISEIYFEVWYKEKEPDEEENPLYNTTSTGRYTALLRAGTAKTAIAASRADQSKTLFKAPDVNNKSPTTYDTEDLGLTKLGTVTMSRVGSEWKIVKSNTTALTVSDGKIVGLSKENVYYIIEQTGTSNKTLTKGGKETAFYPYKYENNGEGFVEDADELTITAKNAKSEEEAVELPESGGSGTHTYYTVGGILLLLSAAGYVTAKRRRRSDG